MLVCDVAHRLYLGFFCFQNVTFHDTRVNVFSTDAHDKSGVLTARIFTHS
jgi:hypothetical protein